METTVVNNPDLSRYEVFADGELAGFADYSHRDGTFLFVHTEVFEQFGGKGLAGVLARQSLDEIRAKGERLRPPTCPFYAGWIAKHPDYQDLIDPVS